MTTSSSITAAAVAAAATCAIGKGEAEHSILKLRYGVSFPNSTVFRGGLYKCLGSVWFRNLEGCCWVRSRIKFTVAATVMNGTNHADDDIEPNSDNPLNKYLSYFKPLDNDDYKNPVPLAFQALPGFQISIAYLKEDIHTVRKAVRKSGLGFGNQIDLLVDKYYKASRLFYSHLTPIQRMTIAKHPNRPTILDHIMEITEKGKWVEIHGDEAGYDDPTIVTGLGSIEGGIYMFIGYHQRNTKEIFKCVPTPHGYKKALQMMKYAEQCGLPIVTFVDTTGASIDLKSEELGQEEAISENLRTMFGLKVPIVTIVTGNGGSAGALLIACANKVLMMENSIFYVGSPGGCAAILHKLPSAVRKEAEKLNITQHYRLKIAGGVISERGGGAHADPYCASIGISRAIIKAMEELRTLDSEELMHHRMLKFMSVGEVGHNSQVEPENIRRVKLSEINMLKTAEIESQLEELTKKILEAEGTFDPTIN